MYTKGRQGGDNPPDSIPPPGGGRGRTPSPTMAYTHLPPITQPSPPAAVPGRALLRPVLPLRPRRPRPRLRGGRALPGRGGRAGVQGGRRGLLLLQEEVQVNYAHVAKEIEMKSRRNSHNSLKKKIRLRGNEDSIPVENPGGNPGTCHFP